MWILYFYIGYKWTALWHIKEASHALNHVSIFVMVLLIEVALISYTPEDRCKDCIDFTIFSFVMNTVMLVGSVGVIYRNNRRICKAFTPSQRITYLSPQAFKYLKYLPVVSDTFDYSNPEESVDNSSQYEGGTTVR